MQILHSILSFFVNFHKINKMFLTILWFQFSCLARKARRVSSGRGVWLA